MYTTNSSALIVCVCDHGSKFMISYSIFREKMCGNGPFDHTAHTHTQTEGERERHRDTHLSTHDCHTRKFPLFSKRFRVYLVEFCVASPAAHFGPLIVKSVLFVEPFQFQFILTWFTISFKPKTTTFVGRKRCRR